MPRPIVAATEIDCASDRRALWPFVADTDRLNRAAGLAPIRFEPSDGTSAARFRARTILGGFAVEYDEQPSEFVENEGWSLHRVMRSGPLRDLRMSARLDPRSGGGTRVRLDLAIEPRTALLGPLVRRNARRTVETFARLVRSIDAALGRQEPVRFDEPRSAVQQPALARAQGSLAGAAGETERPLVDRLVTFVTEAQDSELGRIRPFELADRWGVDRGALLSVCLQAVVSGLLELSWELICPSCRNPTSKLGSLADLGPDGHCPLCDLGYGIDLDRSTEVTFRPARAIRPVADARYCMGSPTFVPHVVAQVVLPAHGRATMPLPAEPGRYRLFARGGLVSSVEVAPGAPAEVQVRVGERIEPGRIEAAPAGALTLLLEDDQARHAKLERLDWATLAATAHHLSLSPKWRRLFSAEVLKPGVILKVTRVALLFSDLTQSTALYARAGDAPAFRLVQDHFALLRGIAEKQEGTIVKTIGDAVMAAFADEEHAVRAAVAMQRAFVGFRPAYPDAADVFLKLGVFAGPCYAVTANGLLDYFGQTVNVAARLQGKAHAGEIVVGEDLADRSEAGGWLDGARVTERFDAALKGLDQTLRAARIAL